MPNKYLLEYSFSWSMCTITAVSQDALQISCADRTVTLQTGDTIVFVESWTKFEQGDSVEVTVEIDYEGFIFGEREYYIQLSDPTIRTTYTGEDGICELICDGIVNV